MSCHAMDRPERLLTEYWYGQPMKSAGSQRSAPIPTSARVNNPSLAARILANNINVKETGICHGQIQLIAYRDRVSRDKLDRSLGLPKKPGLERPLGFSRTANPEQDYARTAPLGSQTYSPNFSASSNKDFGASCLPTARRTFERQIAIMRRISGSFWIILSASRTATRRLSTSLDVI